MNWLQFGVQWLHVLLAIMWFGYSLSVYFLVSPAVAGLPEASSATSSTGWRRSRRAFSPASRGS